MTYRPNKWLLVKALKHNSEEVLLKVFGTWSGGYLDGDSWKLSSVVEKVVYHPDHYETQNSSGSVYQLGKNSYGIAGASNYGIPSVLEEKLKGLATIEFLEENDAIQTLESLR